MKLNYNQQLARIYADIFDYYLTDSEVKIWEVHSYDQHGLGTDLHGYRSKSSSKKRKERKEREEISEKKNRKAREVVEKLRKVPTVAGIFLTGSVAVGNAKEESDIDLMIITAPGTLWLTRMAVVGLLRLKNSYGNYPDKICPNIFLDVNHLEITEKNLYTAHEVLQAKCLYDKGNVNQQWLKKNEWAKEYLPKAYEFKIRNLKFENSLKNGKWKMKILGPLELLAFVVQYLYQLPKQTNEQIGWGYAFFHPRNLSEKVLKEFEKRLRV